MKMPLKPARIGSELELLPKAKAVFIEPMLLQRTEALPEGAAWLYELKLDGYRALALKIAGRVQLRSRNDNDFSLRYPAVVRALSALEKGLSRMRLNEFSFPLDRPVSLSGGDEACSSHASCDQNLGDGGTDGLDLD